jgi:hypothetical protein
LYLRTAAFRSSWSCPQKNIYLQVDRLVVLRLQPTAYSTKKFNFRAQRELSAKVGKCWSAKRDPKSQIFTRDRPCSKSQFFTRDSAEILNFSAIELLKSRRVNAISDQGGRLYKKSNNRSALLTIMSKTDAGCAVAAEREEKEGICVINLCDNGGDNILRVVPYGSRRVPEEDPLCLTSCRALALSCAGLKNGSNGHAGAGSSRVEATSAINFQLPPMAPKQIVTKRACAGTM